MSLQTINSFGYNIPRIVANTLLGVPDDTFAVPASLQTIPFFAIKNGDLWRWNTVTFIWEQVTSGGAGNTIYSANDSLAGDRTVSLAGFFLNVDSPLGTNLGVTEAQSYIAGRDATAGGNIGIVTASTSALSGVVNLSAFFDGVSQQAIIQLNALVGGSLIDYTAGSHNFTGLVLLASLAGSGAGIVAVDNAGLLSFTATPAAGANTALSNLAAVAINTSLISDANNTDDLGSAAISWKDIYARRLLLDGATSGTPTIQSDALGNVMTGTNLSGEGHIPFVQSIIVRSDETLVNTTADQNLFASTHDIITVQANTTYDFYLTGDLTHGAVSHSIALAFLPTTAVVTRIAYNAYAWVTAVGTATASQVSTRVKVTTATIINLAGANAVETFEARGTITIGATGGTITPQIKFSVDPTGTILLKADARMHIWPIGNDTFIAQGNVS